MLSQPPADSPRRLPAAAAVTIAWTAVALVFVAQNIVARIAAGRPIHPLFSVVFELEYWLLFLLASPLFAWAARTHPFERGRRMRSLGWHALVGISFALVQPVLADALNYATARLVPTMSAADLSLMATTIRRGYPALAITALWKYAVIIGVYSAVDYHGKYREHLLRSARLEAQLATSQLQSLRMQVHPHFLFNTLHSAAMLTLVDARRANQLLVRLADLLRTTLQSSETLEVPLREELAFLDRYLEIERIRFEDRLTVRYDIDAEAEDLMVPYLILQPLVENAIYHGFSRDSSARRITVRAVVVAGELRLEVEDDGAGLPRDWSVSRAGIGLRNVQARVDAENGRGRPLVMVTPPGGGLCVQLQLPVRRPAGVHAA